MTYIVYKSDGLLSHLIECDADIVSTQLQPGENYMEFNQEEWNSVNVFDGSYKVNNGHIVLDSSLALITETARLNSLHNNNGRTDALATVELLTNKAIRSILTGQDLVDYDKALQTIKGK